MRYVDLLNFSNHRPAVTSINNLGTTLRDDQDQADHYYQSRGRAEPWCRADYESSEFQTEQPSGAAEYRGQAEQQQPRQKVGRAELDSNAEDGKTGDQAEQPRNEGPDDEHVENDTRCDDGHARTYFVNAAENLEEYTTMMKVGGSTQN